MSSSLFKTGNAGAAATVIDLNQFFGPLGHNSVSIVNNHATQIITVAGIGDSFTIAPGRWIGLTGCAQLGSISLTANGETTPFQINASSANVPTSFNSPGGGTIVTANLADGAVTEPKLDPATGTAANLGAERSFTCVYDTAALDADGVSNKTIAVHTLLPVLPAKAVITYAWYQVLTTFTSATDAATIALGVETVDAAGIKTAVAISDVTNPYDAAQSFGTKILGTLVSGVAAPFTVKTSTAAQRLVATVAVEALTAGKLVIHGRYSIVG